MQRQAEIEREVRRVVATHSDLAGRSIFDLPCVTWCTVFVVCQPHRLGPADKNSHVDSLGGGFNADHGEATTR